ncbi:MAG: hypothetical protein A2430_00230 [Candidatus Liptonbacteria bacterium RIFOXYC1_FULL_36_8]|uniref:Aspartyl/glutamyl-tRNA(Asn/Gln) amidotransferase subunit C n=3 Tax=Candidatus Liptoniibacteriota TaxID=1817909 RepID=A0A1G2CN52_9BACT|nr:MAG: hypothetical protein A2390_02165 [Candidatus Liptonbacteria bacterium RIFOXYB1_FULL_36_10]OGZ03036.1 MAG: hypothetical protein A2604_01000 [Candidatus Liptonbacteria bacterium RIFOXYD1_FULL_36_11]OGZ03061.1 MAG: hypothetical protein A2430_00230 [Candidatus Liptonbacteria bacterium RIFOXYC1_FULL_36_8]
MEIEKEKIKHLAELGRIKLTEEEAGKFKKDVEEIVAFFDKLKEVEVRETDFDISSNASETISDEKKDSIGTGKEKKNFMEEEGGYLKIPKVF